MIFVNNFAIGIFVRFYKISFTLIVFFGFGMDCMDVVVDTFVDKTFHYTPGNENQAVANSNDNNVVLDVTLDCYENQGYVGINYNLDIATISF